MRVTLWDWWMGRSKYEVAVDEINRCAEEVFAERSKQKTKALVEERDELKKGLDLAEAEIAQLKKNRDEQFARLISEREVLSSELAKTQAELVKEKKHTQTAAEAFAVIIEEKNKLIDDYSSRLGLIGDLGKRLRELGTI